MKNVWLVLLLLIVWVERGLCKIECNLKDNCFCYSGSTYEFQCPPNSGESGGFVIHVDKDEVLIDCSGMEKFDMRLLPNVTIDRIERLRLRFCPLPDRGFKEILDWFSLKEIHSLHFQNSNLGNVTLTKDYFEGLDYLLNLNLNNNNLTNVDEDVFVNVPNLTKLELQGNNIRLKPNLFKNTPHLKWLDLADNRLEDIPTGIFATLDKLEYLDLWSNSLRKIDDFAFAGLTSLKSVELSVNKIQSISSNAFKSLPDLLRVSLRRNNLSFFPSDTFINNGKIKLIRMASNPNLNLPEHAFANLTSLEEVQLTDCRLQTIPGNIFEGSVNLKTVTLDQNKLKHLPETLFKGLVNLEKIYLMHNKIENVTSTFGSLKHLKLLHLQNNAIGEIVKETFKDLTNLEEINLSGNRIAKIHHFAFNQNEKLKIINLSKNKYSGEHNSQFILLENVVGAENINLSYNLITQIDDIVRLYNKVNLTRLDLSHNHITCVKLQDMTPLVKKLIVNLEHNNITVVDFSLVEYIASSGDMKDAFSNSDPTFTTVFLANNPLDCNCINYDLLRYTRDAMLPEVKVMFDIKTENLTCASPPELEGFLLQTLKPKLLTCPLNKIITRDTGCPYNCSCSWRPFDTTVVVDCSNMNLTEFPEIVLDQMKPIRFNQTEVHLEENNLIVGPGSNLTGYDNVTRLYLSYNNIETITWLPPQLEVLHLDNNELSHLNYDVLHTLNSSNLINLSLNNNPWNCGCDSVNFTNFLRLHTKQVDVKDIHCSNSTRLMINLNKNDLCQERQFVHLVLIVVTVLLMVAVAFALYYRYQIELKVWLYAHNLCLWWVTEEELDKDKTYDAFISYSHKDEDFLVESLLPVLESGPQPYKLCLHQRHWIPGEFITTHITNSVLESRRTLVILSPNFLESVWGKMEFRTAHTHAMTEGRARVIVVLYGDVDVDSVDDEFKTYLKTNTYLKWGDPNFWNKLKYALPHSKGNVTNNKQKIANVMSCIDDKFNLVAPVSPSPGTTPPVLALDSSALKKHPLNFVSSPELDTPPAESGTLLVSTGL
jgi:protein toll